MVLVKIHKIKIWSLSRNTGRSPFYICPYITRKLGGIHNSFATHGSSKDEHLLCRRPHLERG